MHPTNIKERQAIALERLLQAELIKMNWEDALEATQAKGVHKCGTCGQKRGWKKGTARPTYLTCPCSMGFEETRGVSCIIVQK